MDYMGEIRSVLAYPESPTFNHWNNICLILGGETDHERLQGEIMPYLEGHYTKTAPDSKRYWFEDIAESPLQSLVTHVVRPERPHEDKGGSMPDFLTYDPIYLKHLCVHEDLFGDDARFLPSGFFSNKRLDFLYWGVGTNLPQGIHARCVHLARNLPRDYHGKWEDWVVNPSLYFVTKPDLVVSDYWAWVGEMMTDPVWLAFAQEYLVLISASARQWNLVLDPQHGHPAYPIVHTKDLSHFAAKQVPVCLPGYHDLGDEERVASFVEREREYLRGLRK